MFLLISFEMGNDDELVGRQIPFTPFHGLFDLLFDEPDPMRHELPSRSRDPFFDLFFPFKRYDQFDIQVNTKLRFFAAAQRGAAPEGREL